MIPSHDDFLPDLIEPVMICAFSGWNDAGEAATSAVEHLALLWDSTDYGVIEGDDYYDYQVNRPMVSLRSGVSRELAWPEIQVNLARQPVSGRDVVLVSGPEPNMRWKTFCEEILDVARDLSVDRIVLLGGMGADTHYARPVPVTGSAWDRASSERYGLELSGYRGPTGITGVLHHCAVSAGIPAVSLWASSPYYVSAPSWAPATIALLRRLEEVIGEPIPLDNLEDEAQNAIATVQRLVDSDPSMREQIEALAEEPKEQVSDDAGEQLAEDFERYLRRQDGDPD